MKKVVKVTLTLVLAMAMTFAFAACGGSDDSGSEKASSAASSAAAGAFTATEGELHMATNAAFPPYESKNGENFEGIDVEIAEAIAKKLDLKLVVDDMEFSSIIAAVQTGKSDIAMAGMTVTEERKKNLDFTETYSTGVQVIIVPEDSDIKSVDDLANDKTIGCQDGTTGFIYCAASKEDGGYGEDHVKGYANGATAIQALVGGKVDAVVIDSNPAKEFVKANEGLKILDTEYVKEDYAIGISKDNKDLYKAVNDALKELKEDGTVDKIVNKYIKAE